MTVSQTTDTSRELESVESFRARARKWLASNYPRLEEGEDPFDALDERDAIAHARHLQRLLFDGGFAGIVFPKEFGGLGLTPEHQRALAELGPCAIHRKSFKPVQDAFARQSELKFAS